MARTMSLACFLFSAMVSAVAGASGQAQLRARSFVQTLDFKHVFRVCNADPYNAAVAVWLGKHIISQGRLAYKECGELRHGWLHTGDKIDFKVGAHNVGTFTISDLPQADAVLFIVLCRHDAQSTAVSFKSHTFADKLAGPAGSQAQVAVMDTYHNDPTKDWEPVTHSDFRMNNNTHSEFLRYGDVVAVTPGIYDLTLEVRVQLGPEYRSTAADGLTLISQASDQLVVKEHEFYVVMRCGEDSQLLRMSDNPESLLVYPRSDPAEFEKSAASPQAVLAAVFLPLLFALLR